MVDWQIIALVAGGIGLFIGFLLARSSQQETPVVSGIARVFHYLAAVALGAVPIGVITGIIIATFSEGVRVAIGAMVAAIVLTLIYAIPESLAQAGQPQAKRGYFGLAWDRWLLITKPIGDFNARLLMGIFYFTILVPFGLISRLGSDRLRLKMPAEGQPLWQAREQAGDLSVDDARRQF